MIPFVELYLKKLITDSIANIKANPDLIDRMFSLIDKDSSNKFKTFITTKHVSAVIGYPRSEYATLPCICIMLGSEDEEFNALGDFEQDGFYADIGLDDAGEETEIDVSENIYGTYMNSGFRLECWSDNGELTTLLYYLMKYIILSNRNKITRDTGMELPKMSGGDLEPVPDYFPVFVFRRAVVLSGKVENTIGSSDYEDGIVDSVVIHGTMVEEEVI